MTSRSRVWESVVAARLPGSSPDWFTTTCLAVAHSLLRVLISQNIYMILEPSQDEGS